MGDLGSLQGNPASLHPGAPEEPQAGRCVTPPAPPVPQPAIESLWKEGGGPTCSQEAGRM